MAAAGCGTRLSKLARRTALLAARLVSCLAASRRLAHGLRALRAPVLARPEAAVPAGPGLPDARRSPRCRARTRFPRSRWPRSPPFRALHGVEGALCPAPSFAGSRRRAAAATLAFRALCFAPFLARRGLESGMLAARAARRPFPRRRERRFPRPGRAIARFSPRSLRPSPLRPTAFQLSPRSFRSFAQ